MTENKRFPAPDGLADAGVELWDEVIAGLPAGWQLDERETALLKLAGKQADVVAELDALVETEGLMTDGSTGQRVLHPGVSEARQGRQTIDRLLGKISLPAPEKSGGEDSASQRATKAANARWSKDARRAARG